MEKDAIGRLGNELGQLESNLSNLRIPDIGTAIGSLARGFAGTASGIISSTIGAEKQSLERRITTLESQIISFEYEIDALEASWIDFQNKLSANANEMTLLNCVI